MSKSEAGLDTAAGILRILGEQSFDTEDTKASVTRAKAEAWSRHLLLGTAHPERGVEPASERERDYGGARRFVEALRRSELNYVRKSLGEFRQIIMSLVQNFHRAVAIEGDEDRRVAQQIDRLRSAIESNSIDKLKLEASSVALSLSTLVQAREQRRSIQFEELGTELKTMHKRLEDARKSSETCALTGLHNRRALDAYLDRVVEFDGLTGVPALIMIMDVDNFKLINDNFGHPVGDEALKALAREMLKLFLRKCDFVARYGGEEFVVVVRDMEYKLAGQLAERARERLASTRMPAHPELHLSVSIGVAELRTGDDASTWLMRADAALLRAKQQGKNRVVLAA
ncbi:MAG: diguanylate cyclase protein [Myxococcaceae bacterium]|nr:diguanylate cyclase protein [Myxococcaceae bacterium]